MSDVALARNLIMEIAGHCWSGKSDMLERVHRTCVQHGKSFSRRRLRGFYHRESAGVRFHEMVALADVAAAERQARKELHEARSAHAQFIAETAALASMLERQDADFHGGSIEALRSAAGGMDRAGAAGRIAGGAE